MFFFFFQAEDGIRDVAVTGVQTCALPISRAANRPGPSLSSPPHSGGPIARDRRRAGWSCSRPAPRTSPSRSEEHTSELQSRLHLVCRLLLEKKKKKKKNTILESNYALESQ